MNRQKLSHQSCLAVFSERTIEVLQGIRGRKWGCNECCRRMTGLVRTNIHAAKILQYIPLLLLCQSDDVKQPKDLFREVALRHRLLQWVGVWCSLPTVLLRLYC